MSRFVVKIDRQSCMGSGNCAYWAPASFDLDDEGIAVLIGDPSVDAERVRLAIDGCPTSSISLSED